MVKTLTKWCLLFLPLQGALLSAVVAGPPAATRIVIRGAEQVTDGWVRTDGTASFTAPTLAGHGRAWSAYDHILMRFDLQSVNALRHGRVRKAILRLHVLEARNPSAK